MEVGREEGMRPIRRAFAVEQDEVVVKKSYLRGLRTTVNIMFYMCAFAFAGLISLSIYHVMETNRVKGLVALDFTCKYKGQRFKYSSYYGLQFPDGDAGGDKGNQ